jgi:large subunit ribosomal protein L9
MKVILTQDVPSLGALGDVVTVKSGYARNFLIPKGAAVEFTAQGVKAIEEKKKKNAALLQKKKEEASALAGKLANASCTVAVKVIEEDRLFGSVTAEMIQKALEADGITVDKKDIALEEPIKKLGVYQVPLKLHPEVTASCKVWVVKE